MAFLLNIAIILFGWRRSKDLKDALDAYERAERLAERNANTDTATGLSNRRELLTSIREALDAKRGRAPRRPGPFQARQRAPRPPAGDQLLKSVAEMLQQAAPGRPAARVPAVTNSRCCSRAIRQRRPKRSPIPSSRVLLRRSLRPGAGAGVGLNRNRLDRQADEGRGRPQAGRCRALAAKRDGRSQFAWFDAQLDKDLSDRLSFEEDMRAGIRKGEFVPFFQPLIDLDSRDLVGFEALARWRSPSRGFLEADQFIDVAESTGLVGPLTMSVIGQALKEAATWPPH